MTKLTSNQMLWLTGLTGLTKSCFSWLTSNQILWLTELTELTSNRKVVIDHSGEDILNSGFRVTVEST